MLYVALSLLLALYARARLLPVRVTIRAGRHYPSLYTLLLCALKVGMWGRRVVRVEWHESAASYAEPDGYVGAWSKAAGRTVGWLATPRSHSVRLWWRRTTDGQLAYAEVIEAGGRFPNPNSTGEYEVVPPGVSVPYRILHSGWPCLPHFGGRYPAPQDVRLTLR